MEFLENDGDILQLVSYHLLDWEPSIFSYISKAHLRGSAVSEWPCHPSFAKKQGRVAKRLKLFQILEQDSALDAQFFFFKLTQCSYRI